MRRPNLRLPVSRRPGPGSASPRPAAAFKLAAAAALKRSGQLARAPDSDGGTGASVWAGNRGLGQAGRAAAFKLAAELNRSGQRVRAPPPAAARHRPSLAA